MATAVEVNTLCDEAIVLIGLESWGPARRKLLQANAILAVLPDRKHGDVELRYDRGAVNRLLDQVRGEEIRAARGSGGFSRAGIGFTGNQ